MTTFYGPQRHATGSSEAADTPRLLSATLPHEDAAGVILPLAQQAIEKAPVGMMIVDAETLHIKLANRKAREIFQHFTGQPLSSLYDGEVTEALPWLETHNLVAQLKHVADEGQPLYSQELQVEADSGQEHDGSWEFDMVPLAGTEEPDHDVLVTFRDNTLLMAQKRRADAANFAAQQRTEMLENIFEQIAEGVVVRDREGRVMVYNREALRLARNRSAVEQGRAHGHRVTPEWDFLDSVGKAIPRPELPEWRVMLTETSFLSDQLLLSNEDDTTTPVLIHAAPLQDEAGSICGAIMAFQDISIVKEEERLKDELTSAASHEMRQPITVIQGHAQRLKRLLRRLTGEDQGIIDPEALRTVAESMESQTTRLDRLVSDLLDVSRIQAGHLRLTPQSMSLAELVQQVVDAEMAVTSEHQFVLQNNAPPEYSALEGTWDRSRIEQILSNLLHNAVKYSPAGGEIRVTLGVLPRGARVGTKGHGRKRLAAASAHVAVSDKGIGIPPGGLQHIFERFYRAPNTTDIQGTGLGLYISQQLAAAHHGLLWAESRGLGHGSTFHLALPL
jgi:signal transduction histidine kinase